MTASCRRGEARPGTRLAPSEVSHAPPPFDHPAHRQSRSGPCRPGRHASGPARSRPATTTPGSPLRSQQSGAEIVYSVRFGARSKFPRKVLVENPAVKWLAVGGSGIDHLGPWNPVAVTVTNTAGAAADMMAEYVLGAMLSFSLGLRRFFRQQQARQWIAGKVEPIEGATLLILGLGHTGCAVARRAKAMGMVTLGVRARPSPTDHVDEVHGVDALPGLWGRADFIVCSVPLLAGNARPGRRRCLRRDEARRRADRRLARRRRRRGGAHRRPRWQPAQGCRTRRVRHRAAAPPTIRCGATTTSSSRRTARRSMTAGTSRSARMFADNLARYRQRRAADERGQSRARLLSEGRCSRYLAMQQVCRWHWPHEAADARLGELNGLLVSFVPSLPLSQTKWLRLAHTYRGVAGRAQGDSLLSCPGRARPQPAGAEGQKVNCPGACPGACLSSEDVDRQLFDKKARRKGQFTFCPSRPPFESRRFSWARK